MMEQIEYNIRRTRENSISTTAGPRAIPGTYPENDTDNLNKDSKDKKKEKKQLSKKRISKMTSLVYKLLILLTANVLITIISLGVLSENLTYLGACLDMLVSNICLWLAYSFNEKYYKRLCKPCIWCMFGCLKCC